MALPFTNRVKNAWNAFLNSRDPVYTNYGETITYQRPDRVVSNKAAERTIVASIINRIATDVAQINIRHVKLDKNGRFVDEVDSGLNTCLSVSANIDQTGRAMIHDLVESLLGEGCVALVPVDVDVNPNDTEGFTIQSLRVGKIVEWRPSTVKVDLYDERDGQHKEVYSNKDYTVIIENPFYSVMNEKNSTMQRLIRKLNLLDKIDNQIGSDKLNMIIQLPYSVHSPLKMKQANDRMADMEKQLSNSRLGIAYIDAAEKIIQLNRPIENTLLGQVEYLTNQVYAQLGMTQTILDGTADEKTMLNYQNRMLEPILSAIVEEMNRKFLSKKARSMMQTIKFFSDPFRLVPVGQMAEIADKFTRNEIMTGNEIRQTLGIKPSDDPRADELRNKNLSEPSDSSKNDQNSEKAKDLIAKLEAKTKEM